MEKNLTIRVSFPVVLAMFLILWGEIAFGDVSVIKVALITPEGSTWTNTLYKMAEEVKQSTNGEVEFKIYAGGISGDELDVLRKMKVNRIQAAGFSGVGLGILLKKIRILEAPLLYKSYAEIDFIKGTLYNEFSSGFEKKGYVLLGFAEAGFVYFFSKQNISKPETLKEVKMWVWKGDSVAETFLTTFGIRTFPLHLTDVNTGLETGMINSFYSPPLASVAFQWFSRVRYILDYPMVNSTGAFLLKKKTFDRLSEKNKKIVKEAAKKYSDELVRSSRRDNNEALEALKEAGLAFVTPTKEQVEAFRENALKTYEKNISVLYSRALFDRVKGLLKAYRESH